MRALPKVAIMEVVGMLIVKDLLESAATAGNRRKVIGINNGGGDGASEMAKRCGRNTHTRRSRPAST